MISNINLINQLPGYLAWKNKSFQYLGCNTNLARLLQLKDTNEIVGLADEDLETSEESLKFYRKYDQLALIYYRV